MISKKEQLVQRSLRKAFHSCTNSGVAPISGLWRLCRAPVFGGEANWKLPTFPFPLENNPFFNMTAALIFLPGGRYCSFYSEKTLRCTVRLWTDPGILETNPFLVAAAWEPHLLPPLHKVALHHRGFHHNRCVSLQGLQEDSSLFCLQSL